MNGILKPTKLIDLLQEKVALKKQLIIYKKEGKQDEADELMVKISKIEKTISTKTIKK